ncbi:MAG: BglII/BstYI family type II restriction endonuclease [Candidatus Latescibacter sp.]|nr:BglII/BstYI family type II restriction endonuclease [Candidatus Latescibacter sp.]
MQIVERHSHLNGLEFLTIRKPDLLDKIEKVIQTVDAESCRTKVSKDGKFLFNPTVINASFKFLLSATDWEKSKVGFWMSNRVAIGMQFKKNAYEACSAFSNHLAFYIGDHIDVGIEILPMKALQAQMSSGVPYYEGELYNVIRQGRGVPAVPLVIIGVLP